ncbi:hypothetical protein [Vibrio sp. LaRot3]|uniref:hypothetical protein n=1 Tax=Vibrio sp. LaRot3 TaxID=2998829 RepID=UPI0022CDE8E2|nr:hypothetical protein [Vibrio sp. LaRot3]MDA0148492.1 hypothetical protein [Vibrio sp. LaRot3]
MKDKKALSPSVQHCPLCGNDEYLVSNSGSMLCAGCGSFFENVHQMVATEPMQIKAATPIHFNASTMMN